MITIAWDAKELINQYNSLSSGHFFDKDTMRFFKSRVTGNYRRLDDNRAFFITTEKGPDGIRRATIRHAELVSYTRESDSRESDSRECFKIEISIQGEFHTLTLDQTNYG